MSDFIFAMEANLHRKTIPIIKAGNSTWKNKIREIKVHIPMVVFLTKILFFSHWKEVEDKKHQGQ